MLCVHRASDVFSFMETFCVGSGKFHKTVEVRSLGVCPYIIIDLFRSQVLLWNSIMLMTRLT